MNFAPLRYAVITPARDEVDNLQRLAAALDAQTAPPDVWIVVDNGSTDGTAGLLAELAVGRPWMRPQSVPGEAAPTREAPIARAFKAGLATISAELPDIVVKIDADVSFDPDYFERLLGAFASEPRLGLASGSGYEQDLAGRWREQSFTGVGVWGASRAYRWTCLQEILPLDDRVGWDGVDVYKAALRGWATRVLVELPFRHHRAEGEREGKRRKAWAAEGRLAHHMHYRISYLLLRAAHNAQRDPAALALLTGYAAAALRREERLRDRDVRALLRDSQRLRRLPHRARQALRR